MQVVNIKDQKIIENIRRVLELEADSIRKLIDRLDNRVAEAVKLLLHCNGRVIATGMGKMGAIARKAAATFSSTGTPSIFLHASEAHHGDLGIVSNNDVVIAISNSGETAEIVELMPFMHRHSIPVVAVTGNPSSALADQSRVVLDISVSAEADPISLAPTCSTTAALAMCDALAVALMHERGFTRDQFAIFHPGGNLGRKLLLTVGDVMLQADRLPIVKPQTQLREAIVEMSRKSLGAVFVVNEQGALIGILTDGDLRRIFQNNPNPLDSPIELLMTKDPATTTAGALAAEALQLLEKKTITVLPVVDHDNQPIGAIHLHDLVGAGLA